MPINCSLSPLGKWLLGGWLLLFLVACQEAPTPSATPVAQGAPLSELATAVPTDAAPSLVPATRTEPPAAYPAAPTETAVVATPAAYPGAETAVAATPAGPILLITPDDNEAYLPAVPQSPAATATAVPSPTSTPSPTPFPTVDFAAAQAELRAAGQELGFVKIGFHAGVGTDIDKLAVWMRRLDEAGVPFFLKSVDNASGVPHILVYRRASGAGYDVPNYDAPAEVAAELHWQKHIAVFPPELDPELVWLETINEVDKNRSQWLAAFALKTADLALRDGFRWAALGWASGEPERSDWETPGMLAFLRLVGENPDRLAIALHEYSYVLDEIGDAYPYKVGRFQELLHVVDAHGIPRPTILITEWGWTYQEVPEPAAAMADIAWAARLYAPYPQVKGAAIWFLGDGFADVAKDTEDLIDPVMAYALQNYFVVPPANEWVPIAPEEYAP